MSARALPAAVLALLLRAAPAALGEAASCDSRGPALPEGPCPSSAECSPQPQEEHSLLQRAPDRRGLLQQARSHVVSSVSSRWAGRIVYGVLTSSLAKYHEKLEAQLATWAARPAGEGRFAAVGSNDLPEEWQVDGVVLKSNCGDGMDQISCKEGAVVKETAARGAAWAVILGDDNYVDTGKVEAFLGSKDPEELVAYGVVGCGKGTPYCQDVPDFQARGGFCGGGGYFLSKAALQALAGERSFYHDRMSWPGDMTTSCLLYKHGVRIENVQHGMYANPFDSEAKLDDTVRSGFWTLHYLQPSQMRWVHGIASNASEAETAELESRAFPSSG
ncbi:unnamed protein product [Prorocentrum cordatum]|uniref:Fringe-like glycosyltransferase domain-containing protein n=1 Tax=Prorocentrum cordatum TaxID=2364126 RepID=A0ABN9V150_9DINO|nr:unnamed protein product [Polarella glacialis]